MLVKRRKHQRGRPPSTFDKDLLVKKWMSRNFVALTSQESNVVREMSKKRKGDTALESLLDSQYARDNWDSVLSLLDVVGIQVKGISIDVRIALLATYLEELGRMDDAIRVCPN